MKKLVIILIILASCKNEAKIFSVEVYSVSDVIEMPARINANRFFYNFAEDEGLKKRTISSLDSLLYFADLLEKMKADPECTAIDTRAVLLVKYASHVDTIGGNSFCLLYKGKTYQTPHDLSRIFWGKSYKISQ